MHIFKMIIKDKTGILCLKCTIEKIIFIFILIIKEFIMFINKISKKLKNKYHKLYYKFIINRGITECV